MNDKLTVYFSMLKNTNEMMAEFKPVWENNANIVGCVDALTLTIKQLKTLNSKILEKPKEITKQKQIKRTWLNNEVFIIKQSLVLYYQSKSMFDEMQLLTYPISTLKRMSDDTFYIEASEIILKALEVSTSLFPFGVSQIQIDGINTEIVNFKKLLAVLKLAHKKQSNLLKLIKTKIDECRLMLRNTLDVAVSVYKNSNSDFVTGYKLSRRRIKKSGKHKTYQVTISGRVTDSITKEPIEDVIVMAGLKKRITTTDINGNYEIKIYKKDANEIRFSLEGVYKEDIKMINLPIKKNKMIINTKLLNIGSRYSRLDGD